MPNKPATKTPTSSTNHSVLGLLFAVLGMVVHPMFFFIALICLVSAMHTRNQKIAVASFGAFCVIVAFGYSIGKDMAVRDNHAAVISQDKTP